MADLKTAIEGLACGNIKATEGCEFPILRMLSYSTSNLPACRAVNRILFQADQSVCMIQLWRECKYIRFFPYLKAKETISQDEIELKKYFQDKYNWSEREWQLNKENALLVAKNQKFAGDGLSRWM